MLGRSDGILNPAGVRFGSAEIYGIISRFFADEVEDSLCVGRRRLQDDDETVVLFVKMAKSKKFTPEFAQRIRSVIRRELSPRHVPGIIEETPDIPITINQKKIETVVKAIISGTRTPHSASVANPDSLKFYEDWARSH